MIVVQRDGTSAVKLARAIWLTILLGCLTVSGAEEGSVDQKVALLAQRVYFSSRYMQERNYAELLDMYASDYRVGEKDKKEEIKFFRKMDNRIRWVDSKILRIWSDGNIAKVETEVHGKTKKGLFRWKPVSDVVIDYWIFENDNWFLVGPEVPRAWVDTKATELPVPQPPLTVHIREKN